MGFGCLETFIAGQNTLSPSVNYLSGQNVTSLHCYFSWDILQPLSKHEIIFKAECRLQSILPCPVEFFNFDIDIDTVLQNFGEGRNFDNQTACQ